MPILNKLVPKPVRWRMIPDLLGHIAFLDIETTGLSPYYNHVTCIGVYDGTKVHMFVWGQNLDEFPDFIAQFPAIATFNGACFDVPFLEHNLGLSLPHVHFDLRFLLKRLGLGGGLKAVEHSFGLERGEVAGIDGFTAVLLWRRYKETGDERYLNTMLAYNVEDVVNLEVLLHHAYNGLVTQESLPFDLLPFPEKIITRPYAADPAAVREVLASGSFTDFF
ncbi:MAG TPA: ribonuclease H-like domain-containing protein [Candidatus Lokiarchaeia archaeon]|nr:ribonuclease H-like domain-containing protein [Candidatus Lokiarchaeia archaeon]